MPADQTPQKIQPLSGLDATFLYLETPATPMHVGSWHIYALPDGFEGSFHAAVKKHLAGRLHLSPIFTRKLQSMPLNIGHPIWVQDEDFDIDRHVLKGSSDRPGAKAKTLTLAQAQARVATLHGRCMQRDKPLWEFTVFDSIQVNESAGQQQKYAGFYSKIHHAALDGKGGTVLANAVLDIGPVPRVVAPPNPLQKPRVGSPKMGQLLGAVFSNSLSQYAALAQSLPAAVTSIGSTMAKRRSDKLAEHALAAAGNPPPTALAPKTPLNIGISGERVIACATVPFAPCKEMAKAAGASFNDIVLWICSTALRTYLTKHASIPATPLIAAMPVSLRQENNQDMNTQASMSLANLATHLANPQARLKAIMQSTGKVKEALVHLKSVLPTDYPGLLAPWVVGSAARLALNTYGRAGMVDRLPLLANLIISNVPGPGVPLYLAGARMLTFHPLSIVLHGLGLNITIQTYAGQVFFGVVAGKAVLTHPQDLADALVDAYNQACALMLPAPATVLMSKPRLMPSSEKSKPKTRSAPVKTLAKSVSRVTKKQTTVSKPAPSKPVTLISKSNAKTAVKPPVAHVKKSAKKRSV